MKMNKFLKCSCLSSYANIAPLALRLALGAIFVWHGHDKIFTIGHAGVTGFLDSLGLPFASLMAYILAYGEFIGGLLLIVGLLTHWAAKFGLIVAFVAFFTVHVSNGFSIANGGYEFIVLIGAASLSLLITGAGRHSLDCLWLNKSNSSSGTN